MMNKAKVERYVYTHLPKSIHISLALSKDTYTQEEANKILAQALETWEYIKTLRK